MNENKILKKFETTDVTIELVEGIPMFELYSVGMALGYVNYGKNKNHPLPHKKRINTIVENVGIKPLYINNNKYITISDVKKLITLTHTNSAYKENFILYLKDNKYVSYDEVFSSNRKETNFINCLDNALKPFGINGIRQFRVLNKYRIDYYIKELKLAIEYDENNHKTYTYKQQEGREIEISDALGCKFVRLSDSNDNYYNIGVVMKSIMEC